MPYSDPERRREYGREWMRRNAERGREAMRRWRERHPEEHREENRAYYARDPDRRQQQIDASPNRRAVRKAADAKRRARKLDASGSYSSAEWLSLVLEYGGRCGYCGAGGPMQADHRVPLSRGGTHDIENIMPACRQCNLEKASMSEFDFRTRLAIESKKRRKLNAEAAG